MAEHNTEPTEKAQWQQTSGCAADSKMVHLIVPEPHVDTQQAEQRIQELQSVVDRLQERLEQGRQKQGWIERGYKEGRTKRIHLTDYGECIFQALDGFMEELEA